MKVNWAKISKVVEGIERLVTFLASVATVVGIAIAIVLFRQEINDRLFSRPLLMYEQDTQGAFYFKNVMLEWFYPAKWGMGYALVIRNRGREPAMNVRIHVDGNGTIKNVANNFSEPVVADRALRVLREGGGVGYTWFSYEIDRLRPGGTLVLSFSREDECAIRGGPRVTIRYENEKGAEFEAQPEKPPKDYEEIKAGKVRDSHVDCEMPSLDDIRSAKEWTPEMLYYVRYWARVCGFGAQPPDLARAARKLAQEYARPVDFGKGGSGAVCERLKRALRP